MKTISSVWERVSFLNSRMYECYISKQHFTDRCGFHTSLPTTKALSLNFTITQSVSRM